MDRDARTTLLINQVIAWHNRHPLARRITRAQITGVGTVALPFVGAKDAGGPGSDAGPVSVLADSHAAQEAELSALEAELDAALSGSGQVDPAEGTVPATSAGGVAEPGRPAWRDPLAWWTRWRAARAARADKAAAASARPGAKARAPDRSAAAARKDWRVPVFSENFVPPLKPADVARWARRHAVLELPGAVDGPLREVPVDSGLRRLALRGRRHAAALQTRYVSSAAIEIDDSLRLRCLIGPFKPGTSAAILGPRAWDPRRLALAAGGLMLAMALAAGVAWKLQPAPEAEAASAPVAAASEVASAPAEAMAASGVSEAPAASAAPTSGAELAASAAAHGGSAASAAPAHEGAGPHASAGAASADPSAAHGGAHPAAASGTEATAQAASAAASPPGASTPLGLALSEEARREVREASEAARAAYAARQAERGERRARAADPDHQPVPGLKPGAVVYALVAPLRADKDSAELELSRIKSGASLMPYSGSLRFEVLPSNGQWRATWYPFVEKSSAERTRLMLLKRGVTVELVEF